MAESFPQRLSRLRRERRLNQRTAAAALHISQALLSHYENGLREPGLSFVDAACRYYDVSADYLLGRSSVRASFTFENASPALGRMTEKGAAALLALARGLAEAGDSCTEDAEALLCVFFYALARPFDGKEDARLPRALTQHLASGALGLLSARLLAEGGEASLSVTLPETVRKEAEELLSGLQAEWR